MSEKNESRTQAIRGYVDGKIQWLWGLPENQRRAELAKLRRGIGHAPGELPDLWGSLLQGMPASFYAMGTLTLVGTFWIGLRKKA